MSTVTLELIQKLRERTGVGMMDCKKALIETNGDIEKAIDVLRKKGAAIAQKRSGNATSQGLVHAYIHPGAKIGVMVEVVCETDFVARTEDMKRFAADVAMHIAAAAPFFIALEDVDQTFVTKEREILKAQYATAGKVVSDADLERDLQKLVNEVCLLQQPFIKNSKLTVGAVVQDLIAKMGEIIKVKRFSRFEIGKL